jgi:hypothetical protein
MWCLSRNAGKTLYGTLRQHLGEVFRKLAARKESPFCPMTRMLVFC